LIRYGDLELSAETVARLVLVLEDAGEERLAYRLDRAVRHGEADLVLTSKDIAPILRALADEPSPELVELSRVLEEHSRRLKPTALPPEQRIRLREARMAANEAFFRKLNDQLEEGTPETQPLIVLCECADEDCAQRLEITRREYEDLRSDPTQFVVAHGHAEPEIEEVIHRADRFELVRKIGLGAEIATRLDG
jgi:hypothetical protein